ncbi:hypothetical protein EMPS_11065 [Entomortierella parvispora]|uniref:DUF7707 domain-containing protein n=1 Tax=Entomortierella parvispora TaxID=205924 RepID=A0A9P3HL80_9FUNG|nr:hypothetical protein EMPS_11065 [Entomortierella parvispora]
MLYRSSQVAVALAVLALSAVSVKPQRQPDPSAHPTMMSVQLREMLCAQQKTICTASCQNDLLENTCDVETLTWTCSCSKDTTKTIQDWQFPVPFKLCRNYLGMCLQECPNSRKPERADKDDHEINVMDEFQPWQQQPLQQQRRQQESTGGSEAYHDYDQDDWDAIEELRLLQSQSRLETDTYSRFEPEDVKRLNHLKKSKQLHKQTWERQRNEISRIMAEGGEGDNDFVVRKTIVAFTTYTVPTDLQDPSCVSECLVQFACGTASAPQFDGPDMVNNIDESNE